MSNSSENYKEVFSGDITQVQIVKGFLESQGIECWLKDEIMGTLFPWVVNPAGSSPIKILVKGEDIEEAVSLLKEKGN